VDFGFGIEKPDTEKSLPMVFDLHEFAVARWLCEPQDGTLVNPRMARYHAVGFTGLQ
jgi:hypothetical protein